MANTTTIIAIMASHWVLEEMQRKVTTVPVYSKATWTMVCGMRAPITTAKRTSGAEPSTTACG